MSAHVATVAAKTPAKVASTMAFSVFVTGVVFVSLSHLARAPDEAGRLGGLHEQANWLARNSSAKGPLRAAPVLCKRPFPMALYEAREALAATTVAAGFKPTLVEVGAPGQTRTGLGTATVNLAMVGSQSGLLPMLQRWEREGKGFYWDDVAITPTHHGSEIEVTFKGRLLCEPGRL